MIFFELYKRITCGLMNSMEVRDNRIANDRLNPYLSSVSPKKQTTVNLNTLMQKVRESQKKEKKNNLIFVTAALAILAISEIIISL